ncbi:MAG TPA: tetratricopeptide repeat protein [Solirubrobacteraceae bacterium]|jgi:hypothetical protein
MRHDSDAWERRVADIWQAASDGPRTISQIDALASERPADDPIATYERACARDFAGEEAEAEALYRRALALGLRTVDRRRTVEATVQLASTLRLLNRPEEAIFVIDRIDVQVLEDERDWLAAFRSLALLGAGRAEDAAREALLALSMHLTQYAGAVQRYAGG